MIRVYVGCSLLPFSYFCLKKSVFRCGLSGCVRPWPASQNMTSKSWLRGLIRGHAVPQGKHKQQMCRREEVKREEGKVTVPNIRIWQGSLLFFALRHTCSLAWSHLRSNYLYPPEPCSAVQPFSSRTSNIATDSLHQLSFSFWHQVTLHKKSRHCRSLIIDHALCWIIPAVIHVSDNPLPGEHLVWLLQKTSVAF